MATLKYVGRTSTGTDEASTRGYIASLLGTNLTQSAVTAAITARLADYASVDDVKAKDNLLADTDFIDAADKTRLALTDLVDRYATVDKAGRPFKLIADGKVPPERVRVTTSQRYPNTVAIGGGGAATTSSEVSLFTVSVPDPGYPYRLLVTGSVYAQVTTDNGSVPRIVVYRADNALVASGNGVAESYQAPSLGSATSRMFIAAPALPLYSAAIWLGQWSYTTDWQTVAWSAVNNDTFSTTIENNMLKAKSAMTNVKLEAQVSFANGVIPLAGLGPGSLTMEMRIVNATKNVVLASATPSNLVTGTLTASADVASVAKDEWFTVQLKQTVVAPWGSLNPGGFATWAPSSSGVSNTLTLTPGLAPDRPSGEIPILPTSLASQTTISGPTTLSVRLQSSGGVPVTAFSSPAPRLLAIPIPA